jgi:hypothetical protein
MNKHRNAAEALARIFDDPEALQRIIGPVKLAPASGDWISAREARLLVANRAGVSFEDAASALCRRAVLPLRVRVHTFGRKEIPREFVDRRDYFRENKPDMSHFSDAPSRTAFEEIRELFKVLRCHVPLLIPAPGVRLACWATGDFNVALEMDFSVVTLEIVGVEFDRRGVLESIGAESETHTAGRRRGGPGRMAKWDWEGAIGCVVAVANTPDGLPEGHGAQAAIERIIADYFGVTGPAESQIRLRAARIMETLELHRRK